MNTYTTEIWAIDPRDGDMKLWAGPDIQAISFSHAEEMIQANGLGYCKVTGLLVSEIPADSNGVPDFSKIVYRHNLN